MKIKVDFTLDIDPKYLPALRELSTSEDDSGCRDFVRMDCLDYIQDYLRDNGVPSTATERG